MCIESVFYLKKKKRRRVFAQDKILTVDGHMTLYKKIQLVNLIEHLPKYSSFIVSTSSVTLICNNNRKYN